VQQVAAAQACADRDARECAAAVFAILVGDLQHFIERLVRIEHHQRGHQLGDRRDRRGHIRLAREQHRRAGFIQHQHRAGADLRIAALGRSRARAAPPGLRC
jgi:predicted TPR repeat methyltransferase